MSYVATIPCQQSTGPVGVVTGSTPLKSLGLGCADCGGTCGQKNGMGLFDSGLDISQWGVMEWGAVALGGYTLLSLFHTHTSYGRKRKRSA